MKDAFITLWQYRAYRVVVYVFVISWAVGTFVRALERVLG